MLSVTLGTCYRADRPGALFTFLCLCQSRPFTDPPYSLLDVLHRTARSGSFVWSLLFSMVHFYFIALQELSLPLVGGFFLLSKTELNTIAITDGAYLWAILLE